MLSGLNNVDFSGIGSLHGDSAYIDFWHAAWCGPCRAFESTNPQSLTSIPIRSRDFDSEKPASSSVDAIPTIILYVNGSEVSRATPADTATIKSWDSKYGRGTQKATQASSDSPSVSSMFDFSKMVSGAKLAASALIPIQSTTAPTSIPKSVSITVPAIVQAATEQDQNSKRVPVTTQRQAAAVVNEISPSAPPQIKATAIASVLAASKRGIPIFVPKKKYSSLPWIIGIGTVAVLGIGILAMKMMDD